MSDKPLTPIEIGLTAAIVAMEGNEPVILTAATTTTTTNSKISQFVGLAM